MIETKQVTWVYALQMGLLAGVITLYTGVVGMIELFDGLEIIKDVFSLGQVLVILSSFAIGYIVVRRTNENQTGINFIYGLIAGFFSSLPSILLIITEKQLAVRSIEVRSMFVNVTDNLIEILTFGQASYQTGLVVLVITLTVCGLLGAIVASIPAKLRQAVVASLAWLLGIGMMSELINNQILKQFLDRGILRLIFSNNTLRLWPAICLLIMCFCPVLNLVILWPGLTTET